MVVLASRSPQRRAILEQLGVRFTTAIPDVEEVTSGEPGDLVADNALRKARAVEGDCVLGVDTAVVLDGVAYGKPGDRTEAGEWLRRLSGRRHEVWSGIALRSGARERVATAMTRVHFRPLEPSEIRWYVATNEWRERAGGYAIQGRGSALVERVEGDFWNVVGLPVRELVRLAPELVIGRSELD